jgi:uncharacterized cysteine cluster protein YcgN (CxxCxxCC family)
MYKAHQWHATIGGGKHVAKTYGLSAWHQSLFGSVNAMRSRGISRKENGEAPSAWR